MKSWHLAAVLLAVGLPVLRSGSGAQSVRVSEPAVVTGGRSSEPTSSTLDQKAADGRPPAVAASQASDAGSSTSKRAAPLQLQLRRQVETEPGSRLFNAKTEPATWDPNK